MLKKVNIKVDDRFNNMNIKNILLFFHVGRSKIEELRRNKNIFINNNESTLNDVVKTNDIITFYSEEKEVDITNKKIKVLYEDENYIVVYKEKGLLVHSDGIINDTLINRVSNYLDDHIVYPVNRLDFDTSGIVIFARHFLSSTSINYLIETHNVKKEYLLKVKGILKNKKGKLEFYLGRDRHDAKKMIVKRNNGLKAITYYEVLKEENNNSIIKARIVTGKKHQIRVSFAHINHHIIGDKLYGEKNSKEQLQLESIYLSFVDLISNERIEIKTESYFKALELKKKKI